MDSRFGAWMLRFGASLQGDRRSWEAQGEREVRQSVRKSFTWGSMSVSVLLPLSLSACCACCSSLIRSARVLVPWYAGACKLLCILWARCRVQQGLCKTHALMSDMASAQNPNVHGRPDPRMPKALARLPDPQRPNTDHHRGEGDLCVSCLHSHRA